MAHKAGKSAEILVYLNHPFVGVEQCRVQLDLVFSDAYS
jgi:hypothetical protein